MENMVKVLTWRFRKSLEFFKMLIVKGYSETGLVREWLNQVFDSLKFESTLAMTIIFFFEMFKIWCRF